jgi:hypothetical protein
MSDTKLAGMFFLLILFLGVGSVYQLISSNVEFNTKRYHYGTWKLLRVQDPGDKNNEGLYHFIQTLNVERTK